jgi:acetyl-CoA carboxylase carboxyl transferase subunit beta
MNWLTNFVRPKIRSLVSERDVPDNLWHKCSSCEKMLFHRDLAANQHVCPHCDHHMRITPDQRLAILFDDGVYETIPLPEVVQDPLKFKDSKKYLDRLKENRAKTGDTEEVRVAVGKMGGLDVVVEVQNFLFMGGSLGLAGGEAMLTAAREAVERNAALVVFTAAGGARMQEGILSLMQMPRTTVAIAQVREAGLPYFVVLTDPTTGGVTASYAMLGDIAIAEPKALVGFAGPRVIENTIKEKLPEGFQRAEYLLEHGMIDMVVHRSQLRDTLVRLMKLLRNKPRAMVATTADGAALEIPELPVTVEVETEDGWEEVSLAEGAPASNENMGLKRAAE